MKEMAKFLDAARQKNVTFSEGNGVIATKKLSALDE